MELINKAQNTLSPFVGRQAAPYVLGAIAAGGAALIAIPLISSASSKVSDADLASDYNPFTCNGC